MYDKNNITYIYRDIYIYALKIRVEGFIVCLNIQCIYIKSLNDDIGR
jgi:hypothetical protein